MQINTSTKSIGAIIGMLLMLPFSCYAKTSTHNVTESIMYQEIKQHLETKLYSLPPRVQGHYALRQFRMTGDIEYANGVLVDLITVAERQNFFACQLDNKDFVVEQGQLLRDSLGKGPRAKARRIATEKYPDFVLLNDVVLRYASRIDEIGFIGPCHQKMIKALKKANLKAAYTDPEMIKSWAAQLVNYVYWAKQMGIADLRQPYTQAFHSTYPDAADAKLSKSQYKNKIYGMTHFIFAASGYYQHYVDEKEFSWILSYFEKNIDRILRDTTEDIITEVGISFQITGNANNPVVNKVKQHLLKVYSPKHRMLLSPSGKAHLATGEHRNVLAMMLLQWPETLHPGPYLNDIKSIKKNLPMTVSPK